MSYNKEYYQQNKDKFKGYVKKYRKNHSETFKTYQREYYHKNKAKISEWRKEYYKQNREIICAKKRKWRKDVGYKKFDRKYNLQQKYGITIEQYDEMYNSQNGCCDICKRHSSEFKKGLGVDHCHTTNKVRGLLCGNCNRLVGEYESGRINKVKYYLTKSSI